MKKYLHIVACVTVIFILQNGYAQNYQWAYSGNQALRTNPSLFKADDDGNYYTATYQGVSLSTPTAAQIEKRSATQQLLWSIPLTGNVYFSDVDFLGSKLIVIGYFKGDITLNGTTYSSASVYSGFMFECNDNGTFNWVKILNPYNSTFKPTSIFISTTKSVYLTADIFNGNARCAFHKMDTMGNILKTELPVKSDNATYSHIIADSLGNVYLTGTCGNNALFDNILPDPTQSYQNFFVKYDSNFNAKFLITRNYKTFDDENKLYYNGQYFVWAFHEVTQASNKDSVRIIKLLPNGQIVSIVTPPNIGSSAGNYDFAMNKAGTSSVFATSNFLKLYVYKYDSAFNIIWQDTLQTGTSISTKTLNVFCSGQDFYLTSIYTKNTLDFNSIMVTNLNYGAAYPSDVFVCKWVPANVLPLKWIRFAAQKNNNKVYLNWVTENEINTSHFSIEKSTGNGAFKSIGHINAANITTSNAYSFVDENSNSNIAYYRIRQIDKDGKGSYSKIISVTNDNATGFQFYPNPVSQTLFVSLQSDRVQQSVIKVINIMGKTGLQKQIDLLPGNNHFTIDLSAIAPGGYILQFNSDGFNRMGMFEKR